MNFDLYGEANMCSLIEMEMASFVRICMHQLNAFSVASGHAAYSIVESFVKFKFFIKFARGTYTVRLFNTNVNINRM